MKKSILRVFLFLSCCLFIHNYALANDNSQGLVVSNVDVHQVYSPTVDQNYELRISLPDNYHSNNHSAPDTNYPVIYLLDAQWDFLLARELYSKISFDGMMPDAIIVGITWAGEDADPNALRVRDFLPSANPARPLSGGAESFLNAINDDIIPFVKGHYQVGNKQYLVGNSLGGIFSMFAMLEKPQMFDGIVSLAAPFDIEAEFFSERLSELYNSELFGDMRLYIGVGSLDVNKKQVVDFYRQLKKNHLVGLKTKFQVNRTTGHAGGYAPGLTQGYQFLFKSPRLHLSKEVLKGYEGGYVAPALGNAPMDISISHKGLLITVYSGPNQTTTFKAFASSKTRFYVNGTDIDLSFYENDQGETAVTVTFQGNTFEFIKQDNQ